MLKSPIQDHQIVSRRTALKAFGASAGAIALLPLLSENGLLAFERIQDTGVAPAPKVLSRAQFATLEAFVDAIIPTDERSPGAKEARVADYIDLLLSESPEEVVLQWLGGLAELDEEAVARFGAPFAKLDAAQTDAILAAISANELEPKAPIETFFVMTKQATVDGYYTSEIGIHQELRYKGNKFITEFAGCDTEDGKDCPHCGQRVGGSQGDRGDRGAVQASPNSEISLLKENPTSPNSQISLLNENPTSPPSQISLLNENPTSPPSKISLLRLLQQKA